MNISESFLTALDSLMANKMRAILTMLGVIIGVAAVIALVAIGNGVNDMITGEIQSIGSNLLFVVTDMEESGGIQALSMRDMEALADPFNVPAVKLVAAEIKGTQEVVYSGSSSLTTVSGVTSDHFAINNLSVAAGDILTDADMDDKTRTAVLGSTVATELFSDGEFPIGQSVKINGLSYEVVGVLDQKGSQLPVLDPDDKVYIPLTTAQTRLYPERSRGSERAVHTISLQVVSEDQTDAAIEQISEILRERHGIADAAGDDFTVHNQADVLESFNVITTTITLFLGAIAGISLIVGGIGIMNIMLVSVTERTREIGIRKAVGALKRDVLTQFLIESLFLSLLGGLIGVILGMFGASALSGGLGVTPTVDIGTVAMAAGFAAGVGLIFGIYPAWRASNLRPIEALRYE